MTDSNRIERGATDRCIWIRLIVGLVGAGLVAAAAVALAPGAVILELTLTLLIYGVCAGVCASLAGHVARLGI